MKIAHIMAGAPAGGAELFFERLTLAQHRTGEAIRAIIRADPDRAARLAELEPLQLAFGGALDLMTGRRLRAALTEFAPQIAIAWMNRAARFTPSGDWVLAGRLGGYYDLAYYKRCDHLIGNTRALATWIVKEGWPAARTHYLPNFAPDLAGAAPERLDVPPGAPLILTRGRAGCTRTKPSMC